MAGERVGSAGVKGKAAGASAAEGRAGAVSDSVGLDAVTEAAAVEPARW